MSFIKKHWFGIFCGLIVLLFLGLFVLILIAPRQDLQNRGFIPCTNKLAENLINCDNNKISCLLTAITKNTWCDIKVIGEGFVSWTNDKQATPWSNYIFEPEVFSDKEEEDYLKNNPSTTTEIKNLKKLNEQLESEIIKEEINEDEKPQ